MELVTNLEKSELHNIFELPLLRGICFSLYVMCASLPCEFRRLDVLYGLHKRASAETDRYTLLWSSLKSQIFPVCLQPFPSSVIWIHKLTLHFLTFKKLNFKLSMLFRDLLYFLNYLLVHLSSLLLSICQSQTVALASFSFVFFWSWNFLLPNVLLPEIPLSLSGP